MHREEGIRDVIRVRRRVEPPDRQRDEALRQILRPREILRAVALGRPRFQVAEWRRRRRVREARLHIVAAILRVRARPLAAVHVARVQLFPERRHKLGPIQENIRLKPKAARRVRLAPQSHTLQARNPRQDPGRQRPAVFADFVHFAELRQRHGRGELRHPVLAAHKRRFLRRHQRGVIRPVVAEVVKPHRPRVKPLVPRRHHPAFAGCRDLVVLETVGADVRPRANLPAAVTGAQRLRAILDHIQPAAVRLEHDGFQLRRHPLVMHHNHRPRAWRRQSRDLRRVKIQRVVNLREHRPRAHAHNRRETGNPAPRVDDHLVARPDPRGGQRHLERRGPARYRQRVAGAQVRAKFLLQLRGHRRRLGGIGAVIAEQLLAAQDIQHERLFLRADGLVAEAGGRAGT